MDFLAEQSAFINAQVIPWVLRLVMLGLGLSLTLADFKRVITFPKAAAIGLTAQLIGLPLTAFALAWVFDPAPAVAVGLVILAICPSGVTSNAYTFASRGDVPTVRYAGSTDQYDHGFHHSFPYISCSPDFHGR